MIGKALVAALLTLPAQCAPSAVPNQDRLSIPAIGVNRVIVIGGQRQLDAGNVVNYTEGGRPLCWPDQGCIVYIAGHRTSHGAVFNKVPTIEMGSQITITHGGVTYAYTVVDKVIQSRTNLAPDFFRGDLMVQTSWTATTSMLVYAVRSDP